MKRCKFSSGVYTNIVILSFRLKKWGQKMLVQNKPQKSSRNLIVRDYSIISGLHQFSSESKMEQSVTILTKLPNSTPTWILRRWESCKFQVTRWSHKTNIEKYVGSNWSTHMRCRVRIRLTSFHASFYLTSQQ